MKTTKHIKGTSSLLIAAEFFVSSGIPVFLPIDDFGEGDLVIDEGSNLKKVQVKTIYWDTNKSRYLISCVTSHIRGNKRRTNKKYTQSSFDCLVGIEKETGSIYQIPIDKIKGRRSVTVYPKGKPESVSSRYQDFEKYKIR